MSRGEFQLRMGLTRVAATLHHKLERIASIAVIMFAFGSVGCRIGPARTASNPQISVSGSETWKIAERTWEVQETALLLFPEGESMLVVKALYDGRPGPQQSPLAQELARYALEQGYLDRARDKLRPADRVKLANRIGVALVRQAGSSMLSIASSHRYNFTLEELSQK